MGSAPQRHQPAKTGSGIRAVNMKSKKAAKEPTAETEPANQLASLSSFSDSLEFALDIAYFLSIMSSVCHAYLIRYETLSRCVFHVYRGESLSEIGHSYLSSITLLYDMVSFFYLYILLFKPTTTDHTFI